MNYLMIIKLVCMFLGILFSIVNITRAYGKNDIPSMNFIYQTIGIVGFIVIQFKLYQ